MKTHAHTHINVQRSTFNEEAIRTESTSYFQLSLCLEKHFFQGDPCPQITQRGEHVIQV